MFEALSPDVASELRELGQKYTELQIRMTTLTDNAAELEEEQDVIAEKIRGILDDAEEDNLNMAAVIRDIGEAQFVSVPGTNELVTAALGDLHPAYGVLAFLSNYYSDFCEGQTTLSWGWDENEDGTKGIVFSIDYPSHRVEQLLVAIGWFRSNGLRLLAAEIIDAQKGRLDEELTKATERAEAIRQL